MNCYKLKFIVSLLFYANAVEVNRTVYFSWSNPIRDDPFLSTPMLPMSIPYFTLNVTLASFINDEYYINLPQVELYLRLFDPIQNKHQEILLHAFSYEPAVVTLQNKTRIYSEFPYEDFVPDPSYLQYFTGQTLNMRFKASTNAPGGYIYGELGYLPLSNILSNTKFPLNCPSNPLLDCRTFGYFSINNSTTGVEVRVNGYTSVPATMELWGRNAVNKTNVVTYHLDGRTWSTGQSINATNTTYFIFSTKPNITNLSEYDYGVIQWSWKPALSSLDNSKPDPLGHLKDNIVAFVVLLVASALLFVFVGVAQRCQKNKKKKDDFLRQEYEEIN